jgi:hypothetical protein
MMRTVTGALGRWLLVIYDTLVIWIGVTLLGIICLF